MSAFFDKKRSFKYGDKEFGNYPIQIGYIILPPGFGGKEKYESYCRRKGVYSVMLENRTIIYDCPVSSMSFNATDGNSRHFRIPEEEGLLGERVLCFFTENGGTPFLGFSLPGGDNNLVATSENASVKTITGKLASISMIEDADKGNLTIAINPNGSGEVSLNLGVGGDKNGKLRLNVNGDCEIYGQSKVNILTNDEFNLKIRDLNEDKKFHSIQYTLKKGLILTDKWDNIVQLKDKLFKIFIKDKDKKAKADITVEGDVNLKASKSINIDIDENSPKITIGNAESMALNESTICQFTGLRHLTPITNKKTKV